MSTQAEEIVQPEYKLHVKGINRPWYSSKRLDYYTVEFDEPGQWAEDKGVRKKVKHAFATLRKAIKAYRHSAEYYQNYLHDWEHNVTGHSWQLHKDLLLHFADWMEFTAPLETLMEQACAHAERLRQKREQEKAERIRQHAEFGYGFRDFGFDLSFLESQAKVGEALRLFELDRTATQDDVKKQYRHLAKQYHPDTGGDEEQFKRLNRAYQILLDWLGNGAARSLSIF